MDELRKLRLSRGWKQSAMATLLDCTTSTYTRYESGSREPDLETIRKLSRIFNVSADYILGLSEKPYRVITDDNGVMALDTNINLEPYIPPMDDPRDTHESEQASFADANTSDLEALVTRLVEQALNKRFPPES